MSILFYEDRIRKSCLSVVKKNKLLNGYAENDLIRDNLWLVREAVIQLSDLVIYIDNGFIIKSSPRFLAIGSQTYKVTDDLAADYYKNVYVTPKYGEYQIIKNKIRTVYEYMRGIKYDIKC